MRSLNLKRDRKEADGRGGGGRHVEIVSNSNMSSGHELIQAGPGPDRRPKRGELIG